MDAGMSAPQAIALALAESAVPSAFVGGLAGLGMSGLHRIAGSIGNGKDGTGFDAIMSMQPDKDTLAESSVPFDDIMYLVQEEKNGKNAVFNDVQGSGENFSDAINSGQEAPADKREASDAVDRYTYDALTKKADMPVTVLTEVIPQKDNGKMDRAKVVQNGIANVRQQGNIKNTDNMSFVFVDDIEADVLVNKDSLRHGLTRKSNDTARVTMRIGDILKNAVKINELAPRGSMGGGYVLVGVGTDENGAFYPTRIVVNRYNDSLQVDSVEPLNVVYAIKAKKKNQPPYGAGSVENSTPLIAGSSTVTIADFLDVVKENFADVLPQNVLNHYGIKRPKSTLSGSALYSIRNGEIRDDYVSPKNAVALGDAHGIFARLGFTVTTVPHVSDMPANIDGYVDFDNREVYINPDAKDPQEVVIKHEITHILERSAGSIYVTSMKSYIKEYMGEQWERTYDEVRQKYENFKKEKPDFKVTDTLLESETLAEFVSFLSTDAAIRHYSAKSTDFGKCISRFLRYIELRIREIFKDKAGANHMRLLAMKWEQALESAVRGGAEGVRSVNDILYSFANIVGQKGNYGLGVYLDTPLFNGIKPRDWGEVLNKFVYQNLIGKQIIVHDDNGVAETIEFARKNDRVWKDGAKNSHKVIDKLARKKGNAQMLAVVHVDELLEASRFENESNDNVHGWLDERGWEYKKAYIQDVNGKIFEATLNIAKARDGRNILYDISNVKEVDRGVVPSIQNGKGLAHMHQPLDTSISQGNPAVNTEYAQKNEKDARNDVSFSVSSGRSVSDIIAELEEVDSLLGNENISDEEYRRLDRRSRSLERALVIAQAKDGVYSAAQSQQEDTGKRAPKSSYSTQRLQDAVEAYKQTGDSSGIPTRKSAVHSQKYYTERMDSIMEEIRLVDEEMRSGDLTPEEMRVAQDRKDMLLTRLRTAGKSANIIRDVLGVLDEIDTEARPNHTWVNDISRDLSDKKNVVKYGTYGFNDFERNVKHFFGKHYKVAKQKILNPLFRSKEDYADYIRYYSDRIYNEVVKGLGIKKGSKLSAAVQWLGEGERPLSSKEGSDLKPYTYDDCAKEFGKEKAERIKKAAEIFRDCYDEMLDGVNATRSALYPNNPDKLIAKRKDYFRHFQEMDNSIPGLKNAVRNQLGIDPMLVGVSESTKPKTKWQSMAQGRTGNRTEFDAVGGFLDYLPQAAYATHIDPNIVNIRSLAFDLASAKAKEGANGNPDANSFIRYLQSYASKLAGKTVSHLDRAIADSTVGRPLVAALSWFNNRTKANAILGNFSSMLSQLANITNIVGRIKHESDLANGALDAVRGLFGDKSVQARYNESGFLKERFIDKKFNRFERFKLHPGRLLADALGIADEIGTRITWCAAYREGVRFGKENPADYADSLTRACVAGRGIGEVPLNFESTFAKMFLPFRIEVNNNINVYRDILFGRNFDDAVTKENPTREDVQGQTENVSLIAKLKGNMDKIKNMSNIFHIAKDVLAPYKETHKRVSEQIYEYFKSIGESVVHPRLGKIDLNKKGSKSTISHGFGARKLFAVGAIKDVLEKGEIIDYQENWDGKGFDTYILVGRGTIVENGENVPCAVGVIVKSYPNSGFDNKFYVHEILEIKDEKGHPSATAASQGVTRGGNPSLEIILSQDEGKVKENASTDFDKILQAGGKETNKGAKSAAYRTKKMLQLFVASAIINALFAALKSDEFNPLEDLFGGDEEDERDVLDRIRDLGVDYADGIGDGVVFDPFHAVASGIYQGMTEDEEAGAGEKGLRAETMQLE